MAFAPRLVLPECPFLSAADVVAISLMSVGHPADLISGGPDAFRQRIAAASSFLGSIHSDITFQRFDSDLLIRSAYSEWVFKYRMGGTPASPADLRRFRDTLAPRMSNVAIFVRHDGISVVRLKGLPLDSSLVEAFVPLAARIMLKPDHQVELFQSVHEHADLEGIDRRTELSVDFLGHRVLVCGERDGGVPRSADTFRRTHQRRRWGGPLWKQNPWGEEYVLLPVYSRLLLPPSLCESSPVTPVTCEELPRTLLDVARHLLDLPVSDLGPGSVVEIIAAHGLHVKATIWELYLLLSDNDLSRTLDAACDAKAALAELLACHLVTLAIQAVAREQVSRAMELDHWNVLTCLLEVVMFRMFDRNVTQDPNVDAASEALHIALWLDLLQAVAFLPIFTFDADSVDAMIDVPLARPFCFALCVAHSLGVELHKQCIYRLVTHDPNIVFEDKGSMELHLDSLLHKPVSNTRRGSFSSRISDHYDCRVFEESSPLKEGLLVSQWAGCPQRPVIATVKGFKHTNKTLYRLMSLVVSAARINPDVKSSKMAILSQNLGFLYPGAIEGLNASDPRLNAFMDLAPTLPGHSLGNTRYTRAFDVTQTATCILRSWLSTTIAVKDKAACVEVRSQLFDHLAPVAALLVTYSDERLVPVRLLSEFYLAEALWTVLGLLTKRLCEPPKKRRASRPSLLRQRSSLHQQMKRSQSEAVESVEADKSVLSRALLLLLTSMTLEARQSGRPDLCFGRRNLYAKAMLCIT